MALDNYKLTYTKDWNNAEDFPTYENREEQVRADMQLLFDEMRDAFNNFLEDLASSVIPFTASEAVPENNIQAAIENVQQQAAAASTGAIPERSLDGVKLKLKAVTQLELDDESVGTPQMIPGSVDNTILDTDAVRASHVKDGELTRAKFAAGALFGKADLDTGILRRAQRVWRVRSKTMASSPYTLDLDDAESILVFANAAPFTVVLPANADVAIPVGSMFVAFCNGSDDLIITPATDVTLTYAPGKTGAMTITKQGVIVLLWKSANNNWLAVELPGLLDTSDVTHDMIADNAIEHNNIKDGEVTDGKLGADSVNFSNVKAGAVSKDFEATIPAEVEGVSAWAFVGPPFTQDVTVSGLVPEDPEDASTTVTWTCNSSDEDILAAYDLLTLTAKTDAVGVTTDTEVTVDVPVIATQNSVPHLFTIPAIGYTATGLPYKQTVTVTGLLATDKPFVDLVPADDAATAEPQIEGYGYIFKMTAGADALTVYAMDKPAVALPVQIKAVRK